MSLRRLDTTTDNCADTSNASSSRRTYPSSPSTNEDIDASTLTLQSQELQQPLQPHMNPKRIKIDKLSLTLHGTVSTPSSTSLTNEGNNVSMMDSTRQTPLTPKIEDQDSDLMDQKSSVTLLTQNPNALRIIQDFRQITDERTREELLRELLLICRPPQLQFVSRLIQPFLQRDFISVLPSELALTILSYLNVRSLCRAAQVSKLWHKLATDEALWKRLCLAHEYYFDFDGYPPADVAQGNIVSSSREQPSTWRRWFARQHVIRKNWAEGRCNLTVLEAHERNVVTSLQFDEEYLVTGSDDNTVKVWNTTTKRFQQIIRGHSGGVWALQYRGNRLVTGSTDKTLRVWDMRTGGCVHELHGHSSTVRCLQMHKEDKNILVSGSRDKTLRVWDLDTGMCRYVLVGHSDSVRCLEVSGRVVVSGSYDRTLRLWDIRTGQHLRTLVGHTDKVYAVVFDGTRVVSGSLDSSVRVWDAETGACLRELKGHGSLVGLLQMRGDMLVSGAADRKLKVWNLQTGALVHSFDKSAEHEHKGFITCLQFDDHKLVSGSDDGTVKLWDMRTGQFVRNIMDTMDVVWRLQFSDSKLVVAAQRDNQAQIAIWDFEDGRL